MSTTKILYVDDELDLLDLAASFFEDENLPVDTSSDFHEALSLIQKNNYDIVISDAKMPSGNGLELFQIIKKEGFKGKFILVTGNLDPSQDPKKLGIDLVIFKPVRFLDLIDTVKELIGEL